MSTFQRCWIYGRHQETRIAMTVSVCHPGLYWCHIEKSVRMQVRGESIQLARWPVKITLIRITLYSVVLTPPLKIIVFVVWSHFFFKVELQLIWPERDIWKNVLNYFCCFFMCYLPCLSSFGSHPCTPATWFLEKAVWSVLLEIFCVPALHIW